MRTVGWSIAAVALPVALISVYFFVKYRGSAFWSLDWDYFALAFAEGAGVACLCRLPFRRWVRVACMLVFAPVSTFMVYWWGVLFAYSIAGHM